LALSTARHNMRLIARLILGALAASSAASDSNVRIPVPEVVQQFARRDTASSMQLPSAERGRPARRLQSCTAIYNCDAGDVLTGPTTCTSTKATLTGYVCSSGDALDASTHQCTHRTAKVFGYYACNGGDTLSGSTCYSATVFVAATCPYTLWNGGCYSTYAATASCPSGWAAASTGRCSKDLCAGFANSCNSKCYTSTQADNFYSYVSRSRITPCSCTARVHHS
jgi:hypothetical protein